jgi:NADH dehydrogenase [ubiquinone] 1 alpha subcomplex assembly factor 3
MLITGYFEHGFVLNDTHLFGSLLLFPRNAFLWNCKNYKQIDVESLSLVHMMNPLPVIPFYSSFLGHVLNFKFHYFSSLLVGTGEEQKSLDPSIYKHFEEYGIAVETMSTVSFFSFNTFQFSALSTYNILNQEDRNVAAALITLKEIDATELSFDNFQLKMNKLKEK